MSRCLRKLENDSNWIVYCNTSDVVFPYLFKSGKAGRKFIDCWESLMDYDIEHGTTLTDQFTNCLPNFIEVGDVEELYQEFLNKNNVDDSSA